MGLGVCVRPTLDGAALIDIEVQTQASRQGIVGFNPWRARLSVAVGAPAIEGRANRAVVTAMSGHLGCAPGDVSIVTGHTSRQKTVRLESMTAEDLLHRLTGVLGALDG